VQVLDADVQLGALLLERVEPGSMLASLDDDDETVHVAASLLRQLWVPPPSEHGLRSLESWCAAFDRNRLSLTRGVPGFPAELFVRADALCAELLESTADPVVLHGDLHHFNILRSDRAGWLAIDPQGLVGERYFDLCQFLLNPVEVPPGVNRRRLDIFCAELGLDRQRAAAWCQVHAVLNACWAFEEEQPFGERVAYAEQTLSF
jgi:streptomycin 6-kinase